MKHTPGPWSVSLDPTCNIMGRAPLEGIWSGLDDGPGRPGHIQIARMTFGGKRLDENDANALLIAAAPEMLEALKLYVSFIGNTGYSITPETAADLWTKGSAAIAKATNGIELGHKEV